MAKIIGNTTATPNPCPDWNQTDKTKADYIKNKPTVGDGLSIKDNQINLNDETVFIWDCGSATETI